MSTCGWGDVFLCVAEDPGWKQPLLSEQLAVRGIGDFAFSFLPALGLASLLV